MTITLPPDAVTYSQFVAMFPEFSNATTYPEAGFTGWLPYAYDALNARRFGNQLPLAVMLYVAHNLVLGARAAASAATGAVVGTQQGILTAKAVGDVSAGYDAASITVANAGIWNSTTYGARLYKMMQATGAGPAYAPGRRRRPWLTYVPPGILR